MKYFLETKKNIINTKVLFAMLIFTIAAQSLSAKEGSHEDDEYLSGKEIKNPSRKTNEPNEAINDGGCRVKAGDIASFANGERFNFRSVVNLVASPDCAVARNAIVASEMALGVKFNRTPFRFDEIVSGFSSLTVDGKKKIEFAIENKMEDQLRREPMSSRELLPVLGQLALLSPKAARSTLAYLITQEMISQELQGKRGLIEGRDLSSAVDTISILKRFGADEPLIVQELSAKVENMAASSQADSLGKVLTGLALAAREAEQFALVFNDSAGAFNRGVKQSIREYTVDEKNNLLKAGFSVANASVGYSPAIEPGTQEVNEALQVLLQGKALDETVLKGLWRKVVEVTSASENQTALAVALSLSLTADAMFLPKEDREKLLSSAKMHPSIAWALQNGFLEAWKESNSLVITKKLKISAFNQKKEKFFEPWVKGFLDLEALDINPMWLEEVINKGLVKDAEVQSKFPRLVLSLILLQEEASKRLTVAQDEENWLETQMTYFTVNWNLSQMYLPAINRWAIKHEDEEKKE